VIVILSWWIVYPPDDPLVWAIAVAPTPLMVNHQPLIVATRCAMVNE
jgi:hypothetical protein